MKKYSNKFLLLIVFIAGFSIMGVEITASRLLAPYFGSSLFIWTNIIGVVMVALSLGYHYGGKIADKNPDLKFLLYMFLAAGSMFLVIPFLIQPLSNFISFQLSAFDSGTMILFLGSFFVTILLLAVPLFLLAMTSPFIIRLSETDQEHIGAVAGNVFAVSTVGSIIGTFFPTLWFIPTFGTRETILFFAVLLIIASLFGLIKNKWKLSLVLLLVLPISVLANSNIKSTPGQIVEEESAYQYIEIAEKDGTRYLIYNEGGGIQSVYNPDKILTEYYYDYFSLLPYFFDKEKTKKVAILGSAAGTIPRQLDHFFNNIEIDGIEIDQEVIRLAKEYMGLDENSLDLYNRDGRMFLRMNDKKYDVLVVDAYSKQIYIPWTLTTKEFWQLTKDRITEQGIVAINVNSTSEDSKLLGAIKNTMASVFPETYEFRISPDSGNFMILAGKNIDLGQFKENTVAEKLQPKKQNLLSELDQFQYKEDEMVLTDNRAPVQFLTDRMAIEYLMKN